MGRSARGDGTVVDPLHRRGRRLGWASAGFLAAAVLSLSAGAALLQTPGPRGGRAHGAVEVDLGSWLTVRLPGGAVLLAALLLAASVVLFVAGAEVAFASQVLAAKRRRTPLPAAVARAALGPSHQEVPRADRTRRATAPLRITAVIPAHDEETTIGATIDSLRAQHRPPDEIVVVVDRSTDTTADVATARGVRVLLTHGNTGRKAGALNQALAELLPAAGDDGVVLVMDADTVLVPGFLASAETRLLRDPELQAVGGVFFGEEGAGLVGQLQRSEYVRYARTIARRRGRRVTVLSGTGSVFRAAALRAVAEHRGTLVPGAAGDVYDASALTEDNELTMALRTLGARLVSPRECRTVTEVMPTWRHLWRQRIRWDRGALENVATYGLTLTTTRYWWQQFGRAYATVAVNLYLALVVVTWLATGVLTFGTGFWTGVTAVFVVERVVTVWRVGWRGRLLALPLVVELAYAELILGVFVRSLLDSVFRRRAEWGHVDRAQLARRSAAAVAAPVLAAVLWEPVITGATLATPWFQALSTAVAINTLVFVVVALAHLVPRRQA